ncbi:MAG: hypothetical protein ABR540_13175 [Acidimicrobiales bacterium]
MEEERRRWWATCEDDDPEATHEITFRPVVRVRLALAPGADATAVIAGAVASWTQELASTDDGDGRWSSELWGTALEGEGVVVNVDVAAEHSVEDLA